MAIFLVCSLCTNFSLVVNTLLDAQVPGHRISKHAGVSVFDVSEPLSPKLVQRWDAPSRVEGQDRVGETLVVTNCDGIL